MNLAILLLILQLKLKVLELQQELLTPVIAETSTISIVQASQTAPSCPLYDHYGIPQFCPNQPLPDFCPPTSTRQAWNQALNANWAASAYGELTPNKLTKDQIVQCGMTPDSRVTGTY